MSYVDKSWCCIVQKDFRLRINIVITPRGLCDVKILARAFQIISGFQASSCLCDDGN